MEWANPGGPQVAEWAARTLAEAGVGGDALYLVTPDAGVREALAFWAVSVHDGVAAVSPKAFPSTLSNAPAGRISAALGIEGPCVTLVGGAEMLEEARWMARAGGAARALVVWLDAERLQVEVTVPGSS
jgi:hypothetical protein